MTTLDAGLWEPSDLGLVGPRGLASATAKFGEQLVYSPLHDWQAESPQLDAEIDARLSVGSPSAADAMPPLSIPETLLDKALASTDPRWFLVQWRGADLQQLAYLFGGPSERDDRVAQFYALRIPGSLRPGFANIPPAEFAAFLMTGYHEAAKRGFVAVIAFVPDGRVRNLIMSFSLMRPAIDVLRKHNVA